MSGRAFVDTNILIYAHDESTSAKHARAVKLIDLLWEEQRGVLSTQVLQEFAVNLRKCVQVPLNSAEVKRRIENFLSWEIVINSPTAILRALEIEGRYKLSFWDAMIVQAAQSANCEILYSEDFSHGREYEGVLVVNPFEGGEASMKLAGETQ
jgi:predicted nucleic acid-binding protein